MTRIWVA